ncbi:MAG: B12-binding domain-containing radical SAM protein [Planctomycetota bacterium]|jgi:radical SAM superfamily enzyme YgiQ (UPF0313 family)
MRIALVNISKPTEIRVPQGLLYLASAITDSGHEAIIHDEALTANPQKSLEQILSYNADIVGFSVYSLPWQLKRIEQLSNSVKSASPNTLIIWGGWHATLYPKHSILNDYVNIVVRGPAEKLIVEILQAMKRGRSLRTITGLVLKDNDHIIETDPICMEEQFLYPPLNFELIDFGAYLNKHDRGKGILQYITTRGCNARCRFCIMANIYKSRLIRKPQEQIFSEIEYLLRNYKIETIHFSDDNTFRNEQEALQLCDIINKLTNHQGIPWRCATRINTLCDLSAETYKKLADSGCEGVVVGIESGVDRVLKLMGKGITVSQIHKALRCLTDNGLEKNLFSFLFNFTGETKKEAIETLRMACTTRLMLPKSIIMLHIYFPGASDSSVIPFEMAKSSPLSAVFEQYYDEHIRNYRVGDTPMNILRYYINASQETERPKAVRLLSLRKIQQMLIQLRIKHGMFALPFEYYLSNTVIRKAKSIIGRK